MVGDGRIEAKETQYRREREREREKAKKKKKKKLGRSLLCV